jgi:hypothetical protein
MKYPATQAPMLGAAVDLIPWSYVYRCDRDVQEKPEADLIPRRLRRLDAVYRTVLEKYGAEAVKSPFYKQDDILTPQLPAPQNPLLTGALWVGGIKDYGVTLRWEDDCTIPDPADVEVRTYPTAWGWFGWTNDKILEGPEISEDGREWFYPCPEGATMDFAYSTRVPAATEMIAVFAPKDTSIPRLQVTGGSLGKWRELDVMVEWGHGVDFADAKPEIFGHVCEILSCEIDETAKRARVKCLYSEEGRYGFDSRLTLSLVAEQGEGATVLVRELAKQPVWVAEVGILFYPAAMDMDAQAYIASLGTRADEGIRARVRAHREGESFREIFERVRLWRCPEGSKLEEFPQAPDAQFDIHVPDAHWERVYQHAIEQLRGPNMWGMLSSEVGRVTMSMELNGLYEPAQKIYDYFLPAPGIKSDGDFTDPAGSLEWANGMKFDMGYFHEGTHSSTGKLLFSMMYRYFMTGDAAWLKSMLPRLKVAADWIIRERREYLKDIPNRAELHVAGLMPASMLGDYALPSCDWHFYYTDNAYAQMGLDAMARAMAMIDDPDAARMRAEADAFRADLLRVIKREALLAPVRPGADGVWRSFVPHCAYSGGLLHYGEETNIPQYNFGIINLFDGALALFEKDSVLSAYDRRTIGTVDGMEVGGMKISVATLAKLDHPAATEEARRENERLAQSNAAKADAPQATAEEGPDLWFWNTFADLPKISHNANLYLRHDDIPNFLRYFFNHAVVMVGNNGKMWEHAHPAVMESCENPDNGTAGWFAENFRNMLLMEDEDVLWITKGTPRAWLRDGNDIRIGGAPTYYGALSYTITSTLGSDNAITAEITVPDRLPVPQIKLRLRHPDAAKIKSVCVDGACDGFAILPDGETVQIDAPAKGASLRVRAEY